MFYVHVYVNDRLVRKARFDDPLDDERMRYIAASPPERRYSSFGSALPFADYAQAFDGTPNRGEHLIIDGLFTVHITEPNAFYARMGRVLVPPTLYISYFSGKKRKERAIKLFDAGNHKLLNYPRGRKGPAFYASLSDLPPRGQDQILVDASRAAHDHPEMGPHNRAPYDFCRTKPPV